MTMMNVCKHEVEARVGFYIKLRRDEDVAKRLPCPPGT